MAEALHLAAFLGGGLLVGAVGTLVGTGGGWALVPVFLHVLGFTPVQAAATSLCVVCMNAVSGSTAYALQGRLEPRMILLFAAFTVPGALAGTWLLPLLDARTFTLGVSAFLAGTSVFLLAGQAAVKGRAEAHARTFGTLTARQKIAGCVVSVGVGLVSSVLGVGGGIIHVPFLVLVLGLSAHVAVANSHAMLALTSGVGLARYAWAGHVAWSTALPVGVGAVVGAQLGARVGARMHGTNIRRVLGVALGVFSVAQAWRVF